MSRGPSGRIVIEVDPALKRALHAALAVSSTSLKAWFVAQAGDYVARNADRQQGLFEEIAERKSLAGTRETTS